MAKLKARGRIELLRIKRENATPDGDLVVWKRTTRAFMSDGKILEKRDVRFKPNARDSNGRLHSYGWRVYAKTKKKSAIQDWAAKIRQAIADGKYSPWTMA